MFNSRLTPHDSYAKYLLFQSASPAGAVELTAARDMRHLFLDEAEADGFTQEMYTTMPPELSTWHQAGSAREARPPECALAWAARQGIEAFYRYEMLGEQGEPGAGRFREAMSVANNGILRKAAEALLLCKLPLDEIRTLLETAFGRSMVAGLESYFEIFFKTAGLSDEQLLRYVERIRTVNASLGLPNYRNEAEAKRYAVLNPGDCHAPLAILNIRYDVPSGLIVRAVKQANYKRIAIASCGDLSDQRLIELNQVGGIIASATKGLVDLIRLEHDTGVGAVVDRPAEIKLMFTSAADRAAITDQLKDAEFEYNHLPPTPKMEGDSN